MAGSASSSDGRDELSVWSVPLGQKTESSMIHIHLIFAKV